MVATNQVWAYQTQVVVVSSGASMASNVFNATTDISSTLVSSNTGNFQYGEVVLRVDVSQSISSASNVIFLYRRDLAIDGTNPAPAPSAAAPAFSAIAVGFFSVPPVTASTTNLYLPLIGGPVALTSNCAFFIENRTNGSILAGWTLKVTPKSSSFV